MPEMFEGDPDYEKIKAELEPFITKITKVTGKASPEYQRFTQNVHEWNVRFFKALNCLTDIRLGFSPSTRSFSTSTSSA